MSRRIWLFGGAALWLLAACSDSTATPTVARVTVTPPAPTLAVGEILTLSALALDGSGSVVEGREASWSSSSPAVANVTAGGIVTAVAAGTVVIRATVDDRYGEAMLTVRPAPVARVVIKPSNLTVAIGASLPLTAKAFDAAGHELHGRAITWMSSDASIADVDDSGKVAGRRVGVAIVTATVENKVAEATLAVVVPRVPVDSIRVSPAPVVLDVGRTRQLTAFVFDAEGNRLTDRVVTWTTDAPLVAGVSANGLVSAFGPGYATIVATSEGKTFGVAITVTEGELDAMPYDLVYHRMSPGVVGEIVIMGTAYGAAPMRVNAGTASRSPSPSPTGNRVAFYVGRFEPNGDRTDDIFAVDRDGSNMKRLTSEPGYDGEPAWSPVGDFIAYRRIEPGTGRADVWVMNADGSQKVKLTGDLPVTESAGAPAWSPDASRLAFVTNSSAAGHGATLWTMNADGSDKRRVLVGIAGDRDPTWSPDGSRIAFIRAYDDDTDISIIPATGGDVVRLRLPGQQESPAWSPDGRHVAYWQHVGPNADGAIYTVRADGTNVRLHTLLPAWGAGYDPAWIRRF